MIKNNKYIRILPAIIIIMGFLNSILTDDISFNTFKTIPFFKNFCYKLITMPEIYIAMFTMLIYMIIVYIYDAVTSKKQKTENAKAEKVIFISNIIVICLSVVCVILSSFTYITTESADIPENSQEKYLDVSDFGIEGKITDKGFNHAGKEIQNKITVKKTISATLTLTEEFYYIGDSIFYVYQDILEYSDEKTAQKVAELLSAGEASGFKETNYNGFSKVYVSDEDLIAVIENTVYRITIITSDNSVKPDSKHLLEAIKQKY